MNNSITLLYTTYTTLYTNRDIIIGTRNIILLSSTASNNINSRKKNQTYYIPTKFPNFWSYRQKYFIDFSEYSLSFEWGHHMFRQSFMENRNKYLCLILDQRSKRLTRLCLLKKTMWLFSRDSLFNARLKYKSIIRCQHFPNDFLLLFYFFVEGKIIFLFTFHHVIKVSAIIFSSSNCFVYLFHYTLLSLEHTLYIIFSKCMILISL